MATKATTSFRIDEEIKAQLEDAALERRINYSKLIHTILEDWCAQLTYVPIRLDVSETTPKILILPGTTADELRQAAKLKDIMSS